MVATAALTADRMLLTERTKVALVAEVASSTLPLKPLIRVATAALVALRVAEAARTRVATAALVTARVLTQVVAIVTVPTAAETAARVIVSRVP